MTAESPELWQCRPVSWPAGAGRRSVEAAFSSHAGLEFGQFWKTAPDPTFQPARATIGWQPGFLCVFAVLHDLDIYNDAVRMNEHTWQLGDVLEIFLGRQQGGEYFEFHITPENQLLQLRFPYWGVVEEIAEADQVTRFHMQQKVIDSQVWIEPERQCWTVLACIPFAALSLRADPVDERFLFSLSRYDYTRGHADPVQSSTSLHRAGNFHEPREWRTAVISP